jgi:endo-1,4-beta-D-glucanase Y
MPNNPAKLNLLLLLPLLAAACMHPAIVTATGGTTGSGSGGAAGGTGGALGTGGGGSLGGTGGKTAAGGSSGTGGITTGSGGAAGSPGLPDAGLPDAGPPDANVAPTRGPTAPHDGMNFPFPQNRQSSNCVYPDGYRNEDVMAAYTQWKTDTVTSSGANGFLRVQRPNEHGLDPNSTVSEGIGYGMLIAVYMGDQTVFDGLWKYEQQHLNMDGLMDWYIKADGTGVGVMPSGIGPATDADEDMAVALVMADKQWGGKGSLGMNYLDYAKGQIAAIWNHEILNSNSILPGDWGREGQTPVNISYFAPAYYRLFEKIDTDTTHNWGAVITSCYTTLMSALNSSSKNQSNGLVPAWSTPQGAPNPGALGVGQTAPTNYQYDSCRTPFRIGLDWCWSAQSSAKAYVALTSNFFSGIGVAVMVDGYNLDGTPSPQYGDHRSASFVGPAGVGAMSSAVYQSFLDQAYAAVATRTMLAGGTYYDDSWMVMSLLMMTGNFLDYTSF